MKRVVAACAALFLCLAHPASAQPVAGLDGLWKAERVFGPRAQGALVVRRAGEGLIAEIAGRRVAVRRDGAEWRFELPNGEGAFRGKPAAGGAILGLWTQPRTVSDGPFESPVRLRPDGAGQWRGEVRPQVDTLTFWMLVRRRDDGALGVLLRNPERDFGNQIGADRLVAAGDHLQLLGGRGQSKDNVLAAGRYDPETDVLTLDLPNRGGAYHFVRDGDGSDFYPRGKAPARYVYVAPPALADGLPVATPESVGLDRRGLEAMVQEIVETPMDAAGAPQVHAVLVARHGKLVFEEYFHGTSRERLHTTRSAGKSVTSVLVGATLAADRRLTLASPVYAVMNGGAPPSGLGPRKRAMTLDHLLSMSSGLYCNDGDDRAPGNEETMTNQAEEPDWLRYTLKVPMAYEPGRVGVYCSASPNLALGMVGAALGEDPIYGFETRVAQPLKIDRYAWGIDGVGHPFGGGSVLLTARDLLKFGQLMLNGGRWEGLRILSADYVKRSTSPLYRIGRYGYGYGYLWWTTEFAYRGGTRPAWMALGNGGQRIIVVPSLDLVVAVFAGEFATRGGLGETETALVPRFVMASVVEPGETLTGPFRPGEYSQPQARAVIPPPELSPND